MDATILNLKTADGKNILLRVHARGPVCRLRGTVVPLAEESARAYFRPAALIEVRAGLGAGDSARASTAPHPEKKRGIPTSVAREDHRL